VVLRWRGPCAERSIIAVTLGAPRDERGAG
jgi:hypothetical protein